jgi:uncharacterized protein with PIN domain
MLPHRQCRHSTARRSLGLEAKNQKLSHWLKLMTGTELRARSIGMLLHSPPSKRLSRFYVDQRSEGRFCRVGAHMETRHKPLICPNCDGKNIRRSHRKNLIEKTSSLFFFKPFRCVDCHHRFWSYGEPRKVRLHIFNRRHSRHNH